MPLSQSILRPHLPLNECEHEGDLDEETRHFGAFQSEELVGVVAVIREPVLNFSGAVSWRPGDMAVSEKARNSGSGGKLLGSCPNYAKIQNGRILWCYAGTAVIAFYEKFGFKTRGGAFDFPHVGPVILVINIFDPKNGVNLYPHS